METDKLEQIKALLKSLIDLVAELEAEVKEPPQNWGYIVRDGHPVGTWQLLQHGKPVSLDDIFNTVDDHGNPPQIVDPDTKNDGTAALDWELWWPETWGRNLANGD